MLKSWFFCSTMGRGVLIVFILLVLNLSFLGVYSIILVSSPKNRPLILHYFQLVQTPAFCVFLIASFAAANWLSTKHCKEKRRD